MRVISLTSSNTEIVSLLGLGASLIACDSNSDWPIDLVSSLPRVGPDLQIDFEKVAAFKRRALVVENTREGCVVSATVIIVSLKA